jgi:hypothetical protein
MSSARIAYVIIGAVALAFALYAIRGDVTTHPSVRAAVESPPQAKSQSPVPVTNVEPQNQLVHIFSRSWKRRGEKKNLSPSASGKPSWRRELRLSRIGGSHPRLVNRRLSTSVIGRAIAPPI